jgi:hypothetical protein
MKKIILSALLIILSGSMYSQLNLEKMASKSSFNKAVKALEEKSNRYFLKTGNEKYIGVPSDEADFLYIDNNMYADVEVKDDVLTMVIYTYNPYKNEFLICQSYHGSDMQNLADSKFKRLDGDVYIAPESFNKLSMTNGYILYNESKGLYFHYNIYEDANYHTAAGGGFYKKTKAEKIKSEEIKEEEKHFEKNNKIYSDALNRYLYKQKQLQIKTIMSKPDEGIVSNFQKENIGNLLFSTNVTEQTKGIATSYKSKFTVDEGIKATLFLDKGLNKYIDTTTTTIKENLNDAKESTFDLVVSIDGKELVTHSISIKHETIFKTSGVFIFVSPKAGTTSNGWLKREISNYYDGKEHLVTVQVKTTGESPIIVAKGEFKYIPKAGAIMPYGYACELGKDIDAQMKSIKPTLLKLAQITIQKTNSLKNYTIIDMVVTSKWHQEYPDGSTINFNKLDVSLILKSPEGVYYIASDVFTINKKRMDNLSNGFYRNLFSEDPMNDLITFSCDYKVGK